MGSDLSQRKMIIIIGRQSAMVVAPGATPCVIEMCTTKRRQNPINTLHTRMHTHRCTTQRRCTIHSGNQFKRIPLVQSHQRCQDSIDGFSGSERMCVCVCAGVFARILMGSAPYDATAPRQRY